MPSAHPIQEHFRVNAFRTGLLAPQGTPGQLQVLGELMMQSHASYSACKLGNPGTDRWESYFPLLWEYCGLKTFDILLERLYLFWMQWRMGGH